MRRRLWLSLAMLATGAALMAAAQLAGAAPERKGGIFRYGTTGGSVQIDPQLAYVSTGWWMQYATAAKLYNYTSRGMLVPEVASRFQVSSGGKRYTFFIRNGFRFSDGEPVTAASFKYAIDRVANKDLISPGAQFITNPNGTEIVGAKAVNDGRATDVSGVTVRGNKLVVDLTRRDSEFLSILTMPFFQATSSRLPLDREVVDVRSMSDLPSAGPYAFTLNDVNRTTQLRRNPFWKPGPGRTAPRNLVGLDLLWNLDEQTAYNMVLNNELDEGPLPRASLFGVANQWGVNTSRFWVRPTSCIGWIPFNLGAGLFQGNVSMRRAVNWALARRPTAAQAGPYAATAWTHLLPPGFPGSVTKRKLQPYSVDPNFSTARRLAVGHYKDGNVILAYRSRGTVSPAQAEIIRANLTYIGLNVVMKPIRSGDPYPPAEWDLLVGFGWCADTPDPGNLLASILTPWWPDSGRHLAKLRTADGLAPNARLKALGRLDIEIMRTFAPGAAMHTYNNRYFFSDRVDPRSLKFLTAYSHWSIPDVALK